MFSPACMPWPHAIMPFHQNIRSTDIHAYLNALKD